MIKTFKLNDGTEKTTGTTAGIYDKFSFWTELINTAVGAEAARAFSEDMMDIVDDMNNDMAEAQREGIEQGFDEGYDEGHKAARTEIYDSLVKNLDGVWDLIEDFSAFAKSYGRVLDNFDEKFNDVLNELESD